MSFSCKDCIRVRHTVESNNCGCVDYSSKCSYTDDSSYCVKCVDCCNCYYCLNCKNCDCCENCANCEFCVSCDGLTNKKYMVGDKQYDSYISWLIDGLGVRASDPVKSTTIEEDK